MTDTTDWTAYYSTPYKTAGVTRKITGAVLTRTIKKHLGSRISPEIIELGGANSAFAEQIIREIQPVNYLIVDNNPAGLEKTRQMIGRAEGGLEVAEQDILNLDIRRQADLVLSIGLIEHFDPAGTRAAVKAHFNLVKPGGLVIMTFPTPTFLYRMVRYFSEKLGMWIFHDERPLMADEVMGTTREYGKTLEYMVLWPIILTQGLIAVRKGSPSP